MRELIASPKGAINSELYSEEILLGFTAATGDPTSKIKMSRCRGVLTRTHKVTPY